MKETSPLAPAPVAPPAPEGRVNVNGTICDPAEARVSVFDHGFLFGDSIYETIRTHRGVPAFLDRHFQRLAGSARGLALTIPFSEDRLRAEIDRTLAAAGLPEAVIRLVITRGEGPVTLDPTVCGSPNLVVIVRPAPRFPETCYTEGVPIALVEVTRNLRFALDPAIKSGNYLNNVLATIQMRRWNAFEGVMCNYEGQVAEATGSNIWIVRDGTVITPPLEAGILSGITRHVLLAAARREGLPVEETNFPADALYGAAECFLTSSVKKVMPVSRCNDRPIGDGTVGPLTRRMMALYAEELERDHA